MQALGSLRAFDESVCHAQLITFPTISLHKRATINIWSETAFSTLKMDGTGNCCVVDVKLVAVEYYVIQPV